MSKEWCAHIPDLPIGTIEATHRIAHRANPALWESLGGEPELLVELQDMATWPYRREVVALLARSAEVDTKRVYLELFDVPNGTPKQLPGTGKTGALPHPSLFPEEEATQPVLTVQSTFANSSSRPPRKNDHCPCGSGRLFKRCCRQSATTQVATVDQGDVSENYDRTGVWDATFSDFEAFLQAHGRLPRFVQDDARERRLANWRLIMNRDRRTGKLSKKRQQRLEALPNWSWPPSREQSNIALRDHALDAIENYVEHTGTSLMRAGLEWNGVAIAAAAARWRSQYERRGLTNSTVERLSKLADWSWAREDAATTRCLHAIERPNLVGLVCSEHELTRWVSDVRSAWAIGNAAPDVAEALNKLPGWLWFETDTHALQDLNHPLIRAGIECLRIEVSIRRVSTELLERSLEFVDLYRDGMTMTQIGDRFEISREAVRQAINKLVSQALHPTILRRCWAFWELWRVGYPDLRKEGDLSAETAGAAVSFLGLGTVSPGFQGLLTSRPQLVGRLTQLLPGTTTAFLPAPHSGRHVLDIDCLASISELLVRNGVLFESQVRALREGHPAYQAVAVLQAELVTTGAGAPRNYRQELARGPYAAPVQSLGLRKRSENVVRRNGCVTVGDVARLSEREILAFPNAGAATVADIRQALKAVGVSLSE